MTESAQRAAASDVVSSFGERVEAIRERSERARAALRDAHGSATSADGGVTVEVESSGALRDVRFSAAALEAGPQALARQVLATAVEARRAMLRSAEAVVADAVGPDSAALGVLRGQLDALGGPANDPVAADGTDGADSSDEAGFAGRGR